MMDLASAGNNQVHLLQKTGGVERRVLVGQPGRIAEVQVSQPVKPVEFLEQPN
jgi:hypothetical protein